MIEIHAALFENAPDAILLADAGGRILRANPASERHLGYTRGELLCMTVEDLIPARFRAGHPRHRAGYMAHPEPRSMGPGRELTALRKDGTEWPVDISLNKVTTPEGDCAMAILRDITDRRKAEAVAEEARIERAKAEAAQADLIRRLQDSLREIKVLRGLLPICAYCKKIRDVSGVWQQVEDYVRDHSQANFSHGICPACMVKNFPGYVTAE